MRTRRYWAIALIVVGCVSLAYEGVTYTRREKVFQVGSLVASADRRRTIPLPPWLGAIALAAGIAVLASRRDG
jgi:hypothetical protein